MSAGAINIGDSNSVPSYPFSAVDAGLRIVIADCVFRGNTAYKCEHSGHHLISLHGHDFRVPSSA